MQETKLVTPLFSAACIDGVLEVQYEDDVYITLEIAKKIVAERLDFFGQHAYPCLFKSSRLKGIERAARKYLFSDGLEGINAVALVPGNKVGLMLTTFLISFERPPVPCKVFDTHEKARVWLKTFSE